MLVMYLIFGLLIGSFLNVLIYRVPREIDFKLKRSFCPKCEKKISWYDNIPLLSFIFLKRKCRSCGDKISWMYPLNECLTGLVALFLFSQMHLNFDIKAVYYFVLFCLLLVHFWVDIHHQILPDGINLYLLALNLTMALLYFDFPWQHWLLGAAVGFLGPFTVTYLYYLWRGVVGLGGGDIKLFGVMGIFLGPKGIILTIFFSCLLGSLVGIAGILLKKTTKETAIAFGPSIIIILLWQLFFPESFLKIVDLFFSLSQIL